MKKKVVLFGASNFGKQVYEKLHQDFNIVYFSDNDRRKWGTDFCGKKIIAPNELTTLDLDKTDIVISSTYRLEIAYQLLQQGIRKMIIAIVDKNAKGKDKIRFAHINIDKKIGNGFVKNKISLINTNYSGSSNVALFKLIPEDIRRNHIVRLLDEERVDSEFYEDVLTSQLISSTHETNINLPGQIHVQLCHGVPLKCTGCMSKSEIREPKVIREVWNKFDKVFSYSITFNTLINACFGLDQSKYEITGMPRNDFLFLSDGRKNLSQLLNINLGNKKIIYYLPTFRKCFRMSQNSFELNGIKEWSNIFGLQDLDLFEFDDFLNKNNFILVLKAHPFEEKYALGDVNLGRCHNIFILKESTLKEKRVDLYETLNAADLLITDYSSVFFDYLLLDRPIIFIPSDEKEYGDKRGFLLGPYNFWTPGIKAYDEMSLEKAIIDSLEDLSMYSKQRKEIRQIIHYYQDANSSLRVWKKIMDLLPR